MTNPPNPPNPPYDFEGDAFDTLAQDLLSEWAVAGDIHLPGPDEANLHQTVANALRKVAGQALNAAPRLESKILEIRDSATFIPVVAINMNPVNHTQHYYLRRYGFPCDGRANIAIFHLDSSGQPVWNDPYGWGDRTFKTAHAYILDHWPELHDGSVVDVEFVLGETRVPKTSERLTANYGTITFED